MSSCSFFVPGIPKTKGSWRPVRLKSGKTRMLPQTNEKPWAAMVGYMAHRHWSEVQIGPTDAELTVELLFLFPRPKKPSKGYPRGDVDKLARSLLDALTGIVYFDDSQVSLLIARKGYCDAANSPGVSVTVVASPN